MPKGVAFMRNILMTVMMLIGVKIN